MAVGDNLRVFVLALDGLDYELVKKWRLRYLLQRKHGAFKVGKEYYHPYRKMPYSPIIWTTVITGKSPSEHGVREWWTYGSLLDKLRYLPVVRWIKGKRKLLAKIGLKPHVPRREDHGYETIFERVKPSVAVNVPSYNDPTAYHAILDEAVRKGLDEYIRAIWQVHRMRVSDTFKALKEVSEWKLFMTWLDLADLIGHVCIVKKKLELMKAYFELNRLASKLQRIVPVDTVFLIISDHGMKVGKEGVAGEHSEYAFWSLNIDTSWEPQDFKDLYSKILEWTGEG